MSDLLSYEKYPAGQKPKRRIMRTFKLTEISAVDRGGRTYDDHEEESLRGITTKGSPRWDATKQAGHMDYDDEDFDFLEFEN